MYAYTFYLGVFFVFIVTFSIFPGTTNNTYLSFISPDNTSYDAWVNVIFTTNFSIFDALGRYLAGKPMFLINDRLTLVLTYSRAIFIVTFLLTVNQVGPDWLFTSDWFKMVNMMLFAFSNGFCSTLCAIKAPNKTPEELKESAGIFVSIFLSGGILAGSIIAIFVGQIEKDGTIPA
eukprot:CAMPEP_0202978220 /NCGR_PEP_ID=MMETSP1396-20130829/84718_1 /ASSEMBLY_ACC=CAM_ASM_000872 /TAXON_ID= /ORGANISM="Pseudokeronopsis sp., Strain Brazil" /LENGTH=175 /DNA_ID=CAMNT_0049717123 /DNA_START=1134 /DNA_END=1661 /DNA_ORIENTATION=+